MTCLSILSECNANMDAKPPQPDRFDTLATGTIVPGEIAARARIYHQLYLMSTLMAQPDEQSAVFHATMISDNPNEKPNLDWAAQWARNFLPCLANEINASYLQEKLILWYGRKLGLEEAQIKVVDDFELKHAAGRSDAMFTAITAACFYSAPLTKVVPMVDPVTHAVHPFQRIQRLFDAKFLANAFRLDYATEFCPAVEALQETDEVASTTSSPILIPPPLKPGQVMYKYVFK